MSTLKPLKIFWIVGASYFTVISAIMYALSLSNPDQAIVPKRFLLILLFSFIMGLGTAVSRIDGINKMLGYCLHAAIYIAGFAIFMWLSGEDFVRIAIGTLIFAAIYTVSTVIVRLLYKAFGSKKNASPIASPAPKKQKTAYAESKGAPKKAADKQEKESGKKAAKEEYKNLFS